MSTSVIISIIIFVVGGIALAVTGVRILLKKDITITSRNTKYWAFSPLWKVFIPGAYDPVSFHLRGWKKNIFALFLLLLALCSLFLSWQLVLLASILIHISQVHY